jgi:hypothetical protein
MSRAASGADETELSWGQRGGFARPKLDGGVEDAYLANSARSSKRTTLIHVFLGKLAVNLSAY